MEEWYIKAFASIKASFRGAGLYFLYQLNFYLVFPPATICHHLSPYENSHQGEHSSWRMCLLCQKVIKHFSVDGNCSLIFFFRSCVWTRIINTCNRYKYRGAGETPWVQDKFQKCLNISYSKYPRMVPLRERKKPEDKDSIIKICALQTMTKSNYWRKWLFFCRGRPQVFYIWIIILH